jgi:hypothetical protein
MASTRELLNKIKQRTWVLMIASGGDLDYADAQRAAAKSIAAEERAIKRTAPLATPQPNPGEVTPSNARQWLYDKLSEIALRLKVSATLVDEPAPQFKKHTADPECLEATSKPPTSGPERLFAANKRDPGNLVVASKLKPEPEPDPIIGGFAFGTATSERIDDSEFHRSVQSPTTQNWRKSIELADKRARSRWMG